MPLDDGPLEPIDPATRGEEPHARDRLPDLVLRGGLRGEEAWFLIHLGVAPAELLREKWESWRWLLALPLSREQRRFLIGLVEAYSPLSPAQDAEFRAQLEELAPPLKEVLMTEWTNSWKEEGKQEGLHQGLEQGRQKGIQEGQREGAPRAALRLLGRRVGLPGPEVQARLECLPTETLEDLVETVLDFERPADLVAWLDAR